MVPFRDRHDAGKQLAQKLLQYKDDPHAMILAIPRGALEIGIELTKALHLPLDIVIAKKLTPPGEEEYAIGAVASGDGIQEVVLDPHYADLYLPKPERELRIKELEATIQEKYRRYRAGLAGTLPAVAGKTVIVVDDGIATGQTMRAAVRFLRKHKPKQIIVAVPVIAAASVAAFEQEADELVYVDAPSFFMAVGQFYDYFSQVEDAQAIALLHEARQWMEKRGKK